MSINVSALSPDSMPVAEYSRVNEEQAKHIFSAMSQPQHQADFEVALLPLNTPEERYAAAVEWAAYMQAVGDLRASDRGAEIVISSRDESVEALLGLLEDRDIESSESFVTHSLLRVVKKNKEAKVIDLLSGYYQF